MTKSRADSQALIATALDLPPVYFRRLLQSNAATTVLDFQPSATDAQQTQVIVDRLNQVQCHIPAAGAQLACCQAARVLVVWLPVHFTMMHWKTSSWPCTLHLKAAMLCCMDQQMVWPQLCGGRCWGRRI